MQSCIFIMTVSLIFCVLQLNESPLNRLCGLYAFIQKMLSFPEKICQVKPLKMLLLTNYRAKKQQEV